MGLSHRDPHAAVQAMLAAIAEVDGGTRGCLFVNAVAELAPGDDELVAFAQAKADHLLPLPPAPKRRNQP